MAISKEDYVKFKEMLEFFVRQANKNADNGRAESPVNGGGKYQEKFIKHYKLKEGYNRIAGEDFAVQFFKSGNFNTTRSTYINHARLNVIATFDDDKKIIRLENNYRTGTKGNNDPENVQAAMEKLNRQCKSYTIRELGLNDKKEPNNNLREMLEQFIKMNDTLKTLLKGNANTQNKTTARPYDTAPKDVNNSPASQYNVTSTAYDRREDVARFTKLRANGKCQLCGQSAPFNDKDGDPYLECHHIQWLSEDGSDSPDNTAALCPNCHRKMHILNREEDREKLLKKAKQLSANR